MMRPTKSFGLVVAVFGLLAGVSTSATAGIVFNQTIPGFTVGTGNPTGGFEVNQGNTATIGLRGLERYVGLLPQSNDGSMATYYAPIGSSTSALHPNPANAARWNVDYYVNFGSSNYTKATLTGKGLDGSSLGTFTLTTPFQDSTNLGWVAGLTPAQYNPNVAGTYQFTLTLSGGGLADLSESINISAVPEPSTLISGGIAGVLGLGFAAFRRRRSPKPIS